jgi:hypothetical protein
LSLEQVLNLSGGKPSSLILNWRTPRFFSMMMPLHPKKKNLVKLWRGGGLDVHTK